MSTQSSDGKAKPPQCPMAPSGPPVLFSRILTAPAGLFPPHPNPKIRAHGRATAAALRWRCPPSLAWRPRSTP